MTYAADLARLAGRACLFTAGAEAGGTDHEAFTDEERSMLVTMGRVLSGETTDAVLLALVPDPHEAAALAAEYAAEREPDPHEPPWC